MYQAFSYAFAFFAMLGVLIFVHELGHFLAAKACGIRVLKFSLGFGPPVGLGRFRMRWTRGHTEYVVSWFPLGGFVKMLGEGLGEEGDAEARAHPTETLDSKPMWQKLVVIFAGPAMNLLLPVVVLAGILAVGLPQAESVIGEVEPGSPAAVAGLEPGDRITAIGEEPMIWWRDIDGLLREHTTGELTLHYLRDGTQAEAQVAVEPRERPDVFGESTEAGWLGVYHRRPRAMLGVIDRGSAAYRSGLRTADLVTEVDGTPVEDWYGFERAYEAHQTDIKLTLSRGFETPETLELVVPGLGSAAEFGVVRADVLITHVSDDLPAQRAGLLDGDLILSVDGVAMNSFDSFAEVVRVSAGSELLLRIARDGEISEVSVAPELVPTEVVPGGVEVIRYRIGIVGNNLLAVAGSTAVEQVRNPLVAIPRAVRDTVRITQTFLKGLGKLFTGEVSRKHISGPIGIAEIAGKALQRGWIDYLYTMILISINLGILNLLPIPILDGGQAMMFIVEGVRRAPLSLRTREFVQQIGVTMLILIMGFAFWNDISRNWSRVVDWLIG